MSRVLATDEARASIRRMQSLVAGGLTDQIVLLDAEGRILSDPNVWDGPTAIQFRGTVWPEAKSMLDSAKNTLEDLRAQLDRVAQDIFAAGGG